MTELDKILMDMDPSLFEGPSPQSMELNESDDPVVDSYLEVNDFNPDIVHQENIPNELARSLISPVDYSDDCRYQILSMPDKTLLLKIDERVTEDSDDPLKQRITEYVLNTDDEVQTYEEMRKDIILPRHDVVNTEPMHDAYTSTVSNKEWITPFVIIGLLFLIGVASLVFVLNTF